MHLFNLVYTNKYIHISMVKCIYILTIFNYLFLYMCISYVKISSWFSQHKLLWHSIWHSFWHLFCHSFRCLFRRSIWHVFFSDHLFGILSGILTGILPGILSAIWCSRLKFGRAHWHLEHAVHTDLELAVEVRQCPLRSGAVVEARQCRLWSHPAVPLRSGACCWGPAVRTETWSPAVPTWIWSSQWSAHWDLELAVEVRQVWQCTQRSRSHDGGPGGRRRRKEG